MKDKYLDLLFLLSVSPNLCIDRTLLQYKQLRALSIWYNHCMYRLRPARIATQSVAGGDYTPRLRRSNSLVLRLRSGLRRANPSDTKTKESDRKDQIFLFVSPTGFEPVITGMKTQCPNH